MTEMKNIQELLSTGIGTEGTLLLPRKIYSTIIDEAGKHLIPRELAAIYIGPSGIPGASVDLNLNVVDKMDVRLIAEGAEIFLDQTEYSNLNLKPEKWGVSVRITRELIEDSQFGILAHNLMIVGRRFAENENARIIADALDSAGNSVSGSTAVTIANVTRAMQYLEDNDYTPSDLIIGNEVLNDFRNIDTFVEYSKVGNTEMLARGFLGTIYGMNVIRVSTNAGMTTTTAYVIDRNHAYVMAEKRPVTVERFELPQFDMSAAAVTQRFRVKALRAAAIAKITSS